MAGVEWGRHLNISVHRGYGIPGWINPDTNVIFSSYSGETEETLAAFDLARKKTQRIVTVTTGGALAQKSINAGAPVVNIPTGYEPRCALAFSFFPMLGLLSRYGVIDAKGVRMNTRGTNELLRQIDAVKDIYASKSAKNPAVIIAKQLQNQIPVIYSSHEHMDVVNLRWRGQIQENAKQVAFGNLLPEMNHNEINGWQHPAKLTKQFQAIMMSDKDDHERVKIRFEATQKIIRSSVGGIINVEGKGKSLLSRMFTAIYLGDWVSYHLALLNGVDPTPVPVIHKLKATLAKARL